MKKEELQQFVESFHTMTSILSVEKRNDEQIGTIRIEAGNKLYIKSMERKDSDGNSVFSQEFIPGSNYEMYMEKELNFEKFCYQSAILKKPVHAYIQPERFNFWINLLCCPSRLTTPKRDIASIRSKFHPKQTQKPCRGFLPKFLRTSSRLVSNYAVQKTSAKA